jgi:hypothetical protein
VEEIFGGVTMSTVGGLRATAEIIGGTPVEVDCLVDPSTGGVPRANPFTVTASIPTGGSVEFGPAPMDCTRVFIQLATGLVGACNILWLNDVGVTVVSSSIAAGSDPFLSLIPAGGHHLAIEQASGAAHSAIVTWS